MYMIKEDTHSKGVLSQSTIVRVEPQGHSSAYQCSPGTSCSGPPEPPHKPVASSSSDWCIHAGSAHTVRGIWKREVRRAGDEVGKKSWGRGGSEGMGRR